MCIRDSIITQKWIAIFPLGLEAWAEHRRTGYPKLLPAVENKDPNNSVNVTIGPRRLPFPADEYTGKMCIRDRALAAITECVKTGKGNLLELAVEAARVRATLGEISYACEQVVGRYLSLIHI